MSTSTETMAMPIESKMTEMKTCETCETKMDHWWDDEEGLPFCSSCFKEEGGQCDGCHWDDCVLCHEEEEARADPRTRFTRSVSSLVDPGGGAASAMRSQ